MKAVIFDLDRTLMDHKKAEENAVIHLKSIRSELHNIDDKLFIEIWRQNTEHFYQLYLNKEISFNRSAF